MTTLEINGLTKVFKGKKGGRIPALTDLSLEIPSGEVFGFLGPNGAGKSTTIKLVMGLLKPTGGCASFSGVNVTDPAARAKVGYLPENPSFFDYLTAREYLHFTGTTFAMDKPAIEGQSEKVLRLLDLQDAADRPIRGYSKGMVQRLGLAQAMLHDPELYILDEPMSGLDPIGRALVKNIIRDLKSRGKTVFFSTHITADVEAVCDRVGVIVKGKLMVVDKVDAILHAGIEGYSILVSRSDGGSEELVVQKEQMKLTLEKVLASGSAIERIEPVRKDLEAFFLEVVAKGTNETQQQL